jgi:hypothetical protein
MARILQDVTKKLASPKSFLWDAATSFYTIEGG